MKAPAFSLSTRSYQWVARTKGLPVPSLPGPGEGTSPGPRPVHSGVSTLGHRRIPAILEEAGALTLLPKSHHPPSNMAWEDSTKPQRPPCQASHCCPYKEQAAFSMCLALATKGNNKKQSQNTAPSRHSAANRSTKTAPKEKEKKRWETEPTLFLVGCGFKRW